ncbi:MAG: cadmium-translocating P-type ATPase [bacterium]|nr:cadmium-translocating P-type ATPase [bacterium]
MDKNEHKKQFELDGLACANCSIKIEDAINSLDEIDECNINFMNKILTINVSENSSEKAVLDKVVNIIKKIEPEVVVKEKSLSRKERRVLIATDLCCTDCSKKIEAEIKKIDGVESVNLDYNSKKLTLELSKKENFNQIIKEANISAGRIVKKIKLKEELDSDKIKQKRKLFLFGIGIVLFCVALLFPEPILYKVLLYVAAYLFVGYDVVYKALRNIIYGKFLDENFLMAIASIGAFCVQQYPEGVAVLIFYKIGEFFQERAVDNSRRSIKYMMDLKPDFANLKTGKDYKKVSPEEVNIGDYILVKPGEKVPLDGKIHEGSSSIDTKAITGESVPRTAKEGDEVYSGSINIKSPIIIEVEKEYSESTVAKILELVENAGSKKSKTENFITKFAKVYTPIIVILAIFIAIVPPLVMTGATFEQWIYRAMIFLVVSCPCALVISIPLGFFGGIGAASKKGILIKGSNYLEALHRVATVVFDKTGTLTKGVFNVVEIVPSCDVEENKLLEYAAYAEAFSDHPIALSIKNSFGEHNIEKDKIKNYSEKSGIGINCDYNKYQILCGNSRLMEENKINYTKADKPGTVVYVAVNSKFQGYLLIADEIKEDAANAIEKLKALGIKKTVMLSGDNKEIANVVADKIKIDEVHAELLPDQKVGELEKIEKANSSQGKIMFVGDGMNDAPVITRADIGVAMGGLGVDAAIESADVVIMNDEPSKIPTAIGIARRTRKIVVQNITLALGVKVVVLVLGAIGMATMWEAVFADVGVALLAILNSSRV